MCQNDQKDLVLQNEVNWATQVGEIAANEMLSGTASVGAARSIQIYQLISSNIMWDSANIT